MHTLYIYAMYTCILHIHITYIYVYMKSSSLSVSRAGSVLSPSTENHFILVPLPSVSSLLSKQPPAPVLPDTN